MRKKLEITDLLGNDVNRVLPAVDIDSIWRIINPQICEKKYNGASKTKLKGQRETINHH